MPLKRDGTPSKPSQRAGQHVYITYNMRKQYDSALAILGRMWAGEITLMPDATPRDVSQFIIDCADHKVIV